MQILTCYSETEMKPIIHLDTHKPATVQLCAQQKCTLVDFCNTIGKLFKMPTIEFYVQDDSKETWTILKLFNGKRITKFAMERWYLAFLRKM